MTELWLLEAMPSAKMNALSDVGEKSVGTNIRFILFLL